jgi:hypothetical protein
VNSRVLRVCGGEKIFITAAGAEQAEWSAEKAQVVTVNSIAFLSIQDSSHCRLPICFEF